MAYIGAGITRFNTADDLTVTDDATVQGELSVDGAVDLNTSLNVDGTITSDGADLDGAVVINESGADVDFRIESDTDANALFVEGSSGNVGIGTSSPLSTANITTLQVKGTSTSRLILETDTNSRQRGWYVGSGNELAAYDWSASSELMRIDSSGNLMVGTTNSQYNSIGAPAAFTSFNNGSRFGANFGASTTAAQYTVVFSNPNGQIGGVSLSGTSTSYVTSSDYRLKENVVDMTGAIDRVKALKPLRFNFIADPDTTVDGFLAHEAQEIVPEAVKGEKDAVDKDGNPEYQGIDQAKLVPLLTAALQEAIGRIETLEAEVATLKEAN